MKKYLIIICVLCCTLSFGQRCKTVPENISVPENFIEDNTTVYTIPVVIHVLYRTQEENVKKADIDKMIASLQNDFIGANADLANVPAEFQNLIGNPNIKFEYAQRDGGDDIRRVVTNRRVFKYRRRDAFKESPPMDTRRYLNVYICNTNTGAYTPGEEQNHGIVIDYTNVNGDSRTLTHEAGHWLGLRHIFEGKCKDWDNIEDTPSQKKHFGDLPEDYTECNHHIMSTNFMGYGKTRNFFTLGQVAVMRATASALKDVHIIKPLRIEEENTYVDALNIVRLEKGYLPAMIPAFDAGSAVISTMHRMGAIREIQSKYTVYSLLCDGNAAAGGAGIKAFSKIEFTTEAVVPNAAEPVNWQSSAINALATFISKRFKQEIVYSAVNQIFKRIVDPDYSDVNEARQAAIIQTFFPGTYEQMALLYNDGTSTYYTVDLVHLREVAKNDIRNMPAQLLKKPEVLLPELKNHPKVKDMITIGGEIIDCTGKGLSMQKTLQRIASGNYESNQVTELVAIVSLISTAMLSDEYSERPWVNPNALDPDKIDTDPVICNFYNMMYNKLLEVDALKPYLTEMGIDAFEKAKRVQSLLFLVNELNNTYQAISTADFKFKTFAEKIAYARGINKSIMTLAEKISEIPQLNNHFGFTAAILKTTDDYLTILEYFVKEDYVAAVTQLTVKMHAYMAKDSKYNRLLTFVAQLAATKDEKDMEALLDSYAAPIGSASIKRTSSFAITLNSYAGINGGYEWVKGGDAAKEDSWYAGVAAPIGFTFTPLSGRAGSVSLFLEVLDLGSLVNVRFKNDETTYSDLTFEQFLSPGVGLFYDIKGWPVSVGARYNFISNLRDIEYNEEDGTTVSSFNRDVTRLNFSILVDIPLLTIYNKQKKIND